MIKPEYRYSELTGKIIGCAMEVHNALGNACLPPAPARTTLSGWRAGTDGDRQGFQEVIYQRALEYEMELQKIDFVREFEMPVFYKEKQVGLRRADFLIQNKVSVEIKALIKLEPVHLAQAINYLEAYTLEVGLLIYFGNTKLQFHRLQNKKFEPS